MKTLFALLLSTLFSLSAWAKSPSCDLSDGGAYPRPVLIEEFHGNLRSIEIHHDIMKRGSMGEFVVGSETALATPLGILFDRHIPDLVRHYGGDPSQAKIHSLESELHYIVAMSYEFQILKANKIHPPSQLLLSIAKYILDFDQLRNSWQHFYLEMEKVNGGDTPFWTALFEFNHIIKYPEFVNGSSEKRADLMRYHLKDKGNEDIYSQILDGFHQVLISDINEGFSKEFNGKTLPVTLTSQDLATFGCSGYPCQREGHYKEVVVDLRDQKIAESIAELICQNKGKTKFVLAIIGRQHTEGLREIIKTMSQGKLIPLQNGTTHSVDKKLLQTTINEILNPTPIKPTCAKSRRALGLCK